MASGYAFDRFKLDPDDRRLTEHGQPVDLNARYFDALALLVRSEGQLVPKDRFMAEVWSGIPVTDEALTQCIRTLRRLLGDEAGRPRFIETVPKHGYRFIAQVEASGVKPINREKTSPDWWRFVSTATAGVLGGGFAGIIGGLAYGLAGASDRLEPGSGAISLLLVLLSVTVLVGVIGAAGVSLGVAAASFARPKSFPWSVAGGAAGGFLVGAFGRLLGIDAFGLLVGQSPGNITGGSEGLALGAAVGLGAWLSGRSGSIRLGALGAAACGVAAGLLISLLGGRLMLGSLDLLTSHLPRSRLQLDGISAIFGEHGFGAVTRAATAMLEGGVFVASVVAAIEIARQRMPSGVDQ